MDRHGSVLDIDPDLGAELDEARFAEARRSLIARMETVRTGHWDAPGDAFAAGRGVGLMISEGFMLRSLTLEHRTAAEVLGPGDLLRPWQDDGDHPVYPFEPGWQVVQDLSIAVLDMGFLKRLMPFPEVTAALIGRALDRSRRVAGHLVLAQLASVEHRVLLALWHMADRWGRVRPDGIVLPVRLTHQGLGSIIGARRPSVTTALSSLEKQGIVCPFEGGGFRLTGEPPSDLKLVRGAPRSRALELPEV